MSTPDNAALMFGIANQTLLAPHGLEARDLWRVLDGMMSHQIDYADLYFQYTRGESWSLEEGVVKSGSFHSEQGVGVRAVTGYKTVPAYSDHINLPALRSMAGFTCAIARQGGTGGIRIAQRSVGREPYLPSDPTVSLDAASKVALLMRLQDLALALDPHVSSAIAQLASEYDVVLVMRSDGVVAADVRPLVRLSLQVIAGRGGRWEQGSAGGGGRFDYAYFTEEVLQSYAKKAVNHALINLEARSAPAGTMTVVLGPGWPALLLQQAVGHHLEGDYSRKGVSLLTGRVGERIAARGVTIVDDGTLPGARGSLSVDDEGTPTQRTVLVEDGVLKGFLQDSLNARLTGVPTTGNGRRESFAHEPMPRMTNICVLAGDKEPEEIIRSVKRGLYVVNMFGGAVTGGNFISHVSEGYMIEQGKLTYPVGASVAGNGLDALSRIVMIGNDLALDSGVGTCGKEGQNVPIGVGQPTLRIDGLMVAGPAW